MTLAKFRIVVAGILISLYRVFTTLFFDIRTVINKWRGLPYFFQTLWEYVKKNRNQSAFKIQLRSFQPVLHERYEEAGTANGHYFWQDLWAFEFLKSAKVTEVIDVGSRIDGYIAHLLPTTQVTYVDLRTIKKFHHNFLPKQGSILDMPFPSGTVSNTSCLHVLEHIGLGRYGDPIDPNGHIKAIDELKRITAPDGRVIIGVPVGIERLVFNAHRVFSPESIVKWFKPFVLEEFSLIDDSGEGVKRNASLTEGSKCKYGCGLFVFVNHER